MELSSFSFLKPEDYTSFYSFFQESDDANRSVKRRRFDCADDSEATMKDVFATFLYLDEEQKSEQEKWSTRSEEHTGTQPATDPHDQFQFQLQGFCSDSEEAEQKGTKRARRESTSNVSDASASAQLGSGSGPHRRLWVKDRSKAWWEQCDNPDFPEEDFRREFRMSRATFDMICDELDSAVTKKNTMLRQAIPVRQRVAVCIWRLATGEPLRLVSKRFGLGISTCHKLVLEVCSAIKTVLMPKFLQWPDEGKLKEIKNEFESISGIPNVGGSMYTTHVPIIAPKESVSAYLNKRHTERNQKTSYSITVQGVVDSKGIFTDVCIGYPGSMPDDQILEKSALSQRANRGLLKDVWMVGNSGCPLMDWVLVPYSHQNVTWAQHAFNEKIDTAQSVAKDAFARWKGRWSCLQKRTEVKLQDLPVVLGACCVLHNICEMRNEIMHPELKFDIFDDETVAENCVKSVGAMTARDQIAHHLLHHNSVVGA